MAEADMRLSLLTLALTGAQAVAALGSMAALLILARLMGPQTFGLAMTLGSGLMLLSVLTSLNIEGGAARFMLQGPPGGPAAYVRAGWRLVLAMGTGLALAALVALATFAPGGLADAPGTVALAVGLPVLLALTRLFARQGAALGHVAAASLPRLLVRPLVLCAAALAFWALGHAVGVADYLMVLAGAAALTLAVQLWLLRRPLGALGAPGTAQMAVWMRVGGGLIPALILAEYWRDLVLTSAMPVLGPTALGQLAAAFSLVALPGFALVAAEIAAAPALSRAIAEGRLASVPGHLRRAAALRILGATLAAAPLVLAGDAILALLGPGYRGAGGAMHILLALPLIRALAGNGVLLMTLAGATDRVFRIVAPGLLLTPPVIMAGSALAGITGAAVMTVLCYGTIHARIWRAARAVTGHDPSVLCLWPGPRGGKPATPLAIAVRQSAPAPAHRAPGRGR